MVKEDKVAWIVFENNSKKAVTREMGLDIWKVLSGEMEGTPEQQEFCTKVHEIYLNWNNAPDNYIKSHFEFIKTSAKDSWLVNSNGTPLRPQDQQGWDFAKKWGIIAQ